VAAVSFGIYMWHPVVETLTYQYLWPKWLAPYGLLNFYVFLAVPMVMTIIIARVSSNYYEKWAARWILNRLVRQLPVVQCYRRVFRLPLNKSGFAKDLFRKAW
jgi:peptidoglycan/LPS O-acetylase OafA/YrhL